MNENKKILRTIFYVAISLFLNSSCSAPESDQSHVSCMLLHGSVLKLDGSLQGRNNLVDNCGDYLLLKNGINYAFSLCKLEGDSIVLLSDFGEKGDGPMQLVSAVSFFSKDLKRLVIKEADNSKIMVYSEPFKENIMSKSYEKFSTIDFNYCLWGSFYTTVMVDDSTMVEIGGQPETDEVFSLLRKGKEVIPLEDFPYPTDEPQLEPVFRRLLYVSSFLSKRPNHNEYVWVGGEGNYMSLFSLNGNKAQNIRNIFTKYPKCTQTETGLKYEESDEMGYTVCTTEQYIFLCKPPYASRSEWHKVLKEQSGIQQNGFPQEYNNTICVYTWDGEHVMDFELDSPIKSFIIMDDDRLIGQSLNLDADEEIMIEYDLPIRQ